MIEKKMIIRKNAGIVFMTLLLVLMLVIPLFNCVVEEPLSFIVAQDQRYKATEEYHRPEYFMGVLLAIKEVGQGDFMLSPGDLDPMYATRELVAEVLGADYPWYPAVGNHDIEDPQTMAYFREYNRNGNSLPHIVRSGPPGCEETTYSFEIGDCHVAVINVYFDGKSDVGTDGDVVPEILEWLEEDLKNTDKSFIFVAGHEPLVAQPDMDNGRVRHQGDSLDKYFRNAYKLRELLKKYNVRGIFNGHSHGSSVAWVNGLWQLDAGHAYGLERKTPEYVFREASQYLKVPDSSGKSEEELLEDYFYAAYTYDIKKTLYYTNLTGGVDYHDLEDKPALKHFIEFYQNYKDDPQLRKSYIRTFDERSDQTRSTFFKVTLENPVRIDVYRDDARGGAYKLRHTYYLN